MPKFKITHAEASILRECASRESQPPIPVGRVKLEPGIRFNTEHPSKPRSMNIALVSDDPNWIDTDLHDYASWRQFTAGIDLTEDGRGIFDFYIRRKADSYLDLFGNISAYVENGKLVRVQGYSNQKTLWQLNEAR